MEEHHKTPAGEVLNVIADALTKPPKNHAVEHFPSLRARTSRLQKDFVQSIDRVDELLADWREELNNDAAVVDRFKASDSEHEAFRRIVPIILSDFQRVARSLAEACKPAAPVTRPEDLSLPGTQLEDFINLGTAVRQYVDSIIETSYQAANLDAAKFNFKFLESLMSFAPVAPESLHQTIYSEVLQKFVGEFAAMSNSQRRNSTFTTREHVQFGERTSWLMKMVSGTEELEKSVNYVFKFCSDFVHLGYASVLAIGHTKSPQIVIGAGDYFTAPILNYAELRLRLLGECVRYYTEIFLPVFGRTIHQMMISPERLSEHTENIIQKLNGVRNYLAGGVLFEYVKDGLVGSDQQIFIECGFCKAILEWKPPHHKWDCYCDGCGKQFEAQIVPEAVDYVVSPEGFSKVNGSDAQEIEDLTEELRNKLEKIRQRHVPVRESEALPYVQISDLKRVDVETLSVPSILESRPRTDQDGEYSVIAFVAIKALERLSSIEIHCNCGATPIFTPEIDDNICKCGACNTKIGIFGVAGDGARIAVREGRQGGERLVPIQGARATALREEQSRKEPRGLG